MTRRMLLESLIATQFSWEQWYQQFLYNALVPTTINSKSVQNKAKVKTIEANGQVVNQIFYPRASGTTYGVSVVNNGDGSLTFSGTATSNGYPQLNDWTNYPITFLANHKYLIVGGTNNLPLTIGSTTLTSNGIFAPTSQYTQIQTFFLNGTTYNETKIIQVFDLTQMFGTGNEPTSTSDNRIQKLLNSGYIEYNTGTYKGTDISEFSSEPYNLFDEITELGAYETNNGQPTVSSQQIRAKDDVVIVGGQNYTIELTKGAGTIWGGLLDKDHNIISGSQWTTTINIETSNNFKALATRNYRSNTFTAPSNACYLRFYLTTNYGTTYQNDVCIHLQGTRTGYAPHKTLSPLPFIYQGNGALNSHDTFEITATEYVFTKNVGSVDLGTFIYIYEVQNTRFVFYLPTGLYHKSVSKAEQPNGLCTQKYQLDSVNNFGDKKIRFSTSPNWCALRDLDYTDEATLKASLSGVMLYYQLATPQVIRIPRKRLGIVDLGTLTWNRNTSYTNPFFATNLLSYIKASGKCYCVAYKTISNTSGYGFGTNASNMSITISSSEGVVLIRNDSYTTAEDFKTAMNGIYLFYERSADTTDIADTIDIQSGGTITSDSDVLPNVYFGVKCK